MKLKTKPLKWWQGLLIAIGGVLLAVGGVFLYVYFTSGIGPQKVYPDSISFETTGEDGKVLEEYNTELGQYELSGNFSMKIGTSTAEANQLGLTLSFTNNFTETPIEEKGQYYITNGIVKIPYTVRIGEEFTIQVLTNESEEIIGGITNIYAMTENKIILPASAKIAIDVPVTSIEPILTKIDNNTEIEANVRENETSDISFKVIQGTRVDVSAAFNPSRSQYIFSDDKSGRPESEWRKKDYFIEVLDGKDNFKMNRDDKGIYFSAVGPLTSTARIKIYAFKNAKDQLKFYSKMEIADTGLTVEQYNSVIVELSTNSELAEVVETNITIVEAEVSDFSISRTERMDLKSNKLYTIRANSSEYSNLVLGTTILDKLNEPVPAMISKVAARILVKAGDNWVETDEVKLIGGEKTTIKVNESVRNYTFINSDIRDLANAYWEISSQSDKQIYKMEVVLLMTKTNGEGTTFEIYNNKEYTFEVSFNENVEASVNWNTDETDLSMIVFSGQGQSTQYQKQLSEMINVPVNNIYQKVVYFAYSDVFTDKATAEEYFANGTVAAFDKYIFGTEEEKDWVVLSSPYLLFRKGIQGLKVRFATVKTDAYGNVLEDANKYQIIKFSTNLTIDALEKIDGWNNVEATIKDINCNAVPLVAPEGQTKYVIDRDKEVEITVDMIEAAKANLFLAQKDKMTLQVISNNATIDSAYYTYSDPVIEGSTKIKYTITFKPTFEVGDGTTNNPGKEVTFKLLYHPTDNEIHDETCEIKFSTVTSGDGNGCGFLTVYDSKPNTITVDDPNTPDYDLKEKYQVNIETSTGTSQIKIGNDDANGVINNLLGDYGANIKVCDGYNIDITNNSTINLTSSNSNLIEVDNVKKQVEFKNGITSQSSDVSLTISSGAAFVSVNFTFTSEKVTKIQYLKDDDSNQKTDNTVDDENSVSDETNLTSVIVKKAGFKNNEIILNNLVKVYVGDPESQNSAEKFKEYGGTLTFKLRNIAGMGDNKNYIVGGTETSMLRLTGTEGTPLTLENITSETAIESIKILNDFGVDYPLELRIEGVGISIDLNLIFVNNITGVVTLPTQYNRGDSTVAKPADFTNANGIVYTGVFADYPIPLGDNVKKVYVSPDKVDQPLDWASSNVKVDGTGVSIETGTLSFAQVYEPTDMTFTLYEINGNKYAFYQTFNVRVYPNIKFVSNETILNYTDIAQGDTKAISNYFTLEQYVWSQTEYQTKAKPISGLSYSITGVDSNFPIEIESTTFNFKKINEKVLNLQYGELDKEFTILVNTKRGEEVIVIRDYEGNAIEKEMSLALGYNYDGLSTLASNYMQKVRYGGEDVILFKYSAETIELNPYLGPSENQYSFDLVGNENPTLFTKTDVQKFQVTAPTDLIAQGKSYYLPLAMYKEEASTGQPVAYVRIPLVISQVNSIFAYYDNYNTEKENFDLKTLLTQAENYAELPMDIYSTKSAGASYQIIFENENKYVVAENNNITINGKTYEWQVETSVDPAVTTLTLESTENSEDKVQATEGQKLTFTTANSVNLNYTWSVSEDKKTLTLIAEGIAEGIYNTASYVSTLSVIAEQKLVKISGSELNNKVAGKDLALKLVNGGYIISSNFDKIEIGGSSYTWSLDENKKLVLTLDGSSITENNGTIKVGDKKYSIEYYTLRDVGDSGLVQIANENDNFITIKSLADEERYVIIQMLSSIGNKSYIILYRLRITNDLTITENYPYSGNVEYLDVDGTLKKDLNAKENNVQRFIVKKGDEDATPAFTNQIKSIIRNDGTEYTIGGVYSINETITGEERKYTAGGFITIIFNGDTMKIEMSKDEKNVKVVMNRTYTDVVNGVREYTFYLNVSSSEYIIEYKQEDAGIRVEYKGSAEIDLNPAGEQTFTITTLRQIGTTISIVGENVITEIATGKVGTNLTLGEVDKGEGDADTLKRFNLKQSGEEIATITYDYKARTLAITPSSVYNFTTETTFALIFTAKETKNDETISIQSGIATLNFTFGRTIKIEENNEALYGGMTYDFVGDAGLVKKVEQYKANDETPPIYSYEDITSSLTSSSITIRCYEKQSDGTYATTETNKVSISSSTITTAMLKEDVDVKFDITIEVSGNYYKFTLYRTIKKNVTYVNGTELANDKDNAYTLNLAGQTVAGEAKEIKFEDYLKLEEATITLPEGTEVTKESQIPLTGAATHYVINWTNNGKTYYTTVPVSDITEGGPPAKYTLNKATKLFIRTERGGTFSLEQVNLTTKSGTDPVTSIQDTVGTVAINGDGNFTITPANVAVAQPCAYAIKVRYTFNEYSYTFYINIRMMVVPNTTASVNYPVIGGTALEYETVGTDDIYDKNSDYIEIATEGSRKIIGKVYTINSTDVEESSVGVGSIVTLKRDSTELGIKTTEKLYVYEVSESEPKLKVAKVKEVYTINSTDVNESDVGVGSIVTLKSDSTVLGIKTTEKLYVYEVSENEPKLKVALLKEYAVIDSSQWGSNNKIVNTTALNTISFSNIITEFFNTASDLRTEKRVSFVSTTSPSTNETIDSVSIIKAEDVLWYQNGNTVVLTLVNGKSSGTVTFSVTCNAVSVEYEVYLIAGEVYTINKHYTVGSIESATETIDGINRDALATKTIFEDDRLIALSIPSSIDTSLNNKIVNVIYNYEGESGTESATVQFKLNTGKRGLTIYLEAGRKVDSIQSVMIDGTTTELKEIWNARTTQRITVSYTTKLAPIEIDKDKIIGSVSNTTPNPSEGTAPTGAFTTYEIQSLDRIDTVYTATFNINIGNKEDALTNQIYKFQQLFDIDVDYDYRKGDVAITVTAHEVKNLVSLAGIRHPSTGILLNGDNIGNASVALTVLTPQGNVDDSWTGTIQSGTELTNSSTYNTYKSLIDATFTKMKEKSVKFLTYTDIKNSNNNIYNYNLYGEGAANAGSFVLLKFTYTVDDSHKDFYIWTRILPDYEVKVDGNSITTEVSDGSTFLSTSENSSNPYEVNINADSEGTVANPAYSFTLTAKDSEKVLTIIDRKTNSSDKAINWDYKMTDDEQESSIIYNTNLDKLWLNESGPNIKSIADSPSDSENHYLTKDDNSIKINQTAENVFGTKKYKVVVTNEYGYTVNFYFDIKPKNMRDPVIHSSSTLETITEGASFDIGAVYDVLTITTEAEIPANTAVTILEGTAAGTYKVTSEAKTIDNVSADKLKFTTAEEITTTIPADTEVTVSAGTTAGTYKVTYGETTIDNVTADKLNLTNATTAEEITYETNTIPADTEVTISAGTAAGTYKVTSEAKTIDNVTADKLKFTTAEEITTTIPADTEVTISAGTTAGTYKVTYGETTIDNVAANKLKFTTKQKITGKYDITVETKSPTDNNVVNIEGIDAWGFNMTNAPTQTGDINSFSSFENYFDSDKMLLKYVTVKQIDFLYGSEKVNVGSLTSESLTGKELTLATQGNLQLASIQKNYATTAEAITVGTNTIPANTEVTVSAGTEEGTYNVTYQTTTIDNVSANKLKFNYLTFSNAASRGYSNANFIIPQLAAWIYSDSALSSTSKDSARVTMRIILNFGKATVKNALTGGNPETTISADQIVTVIPKNDNEYTVICGNTIIENVDKKQLKDIQTETYQLTKEITVTRKVEIDKSKQAVVRDGAAFALGKEFTVDGESEEYYFEAKNGTITLNKSSTPTFIDDTLAISLPAAQGRVQNLTVGIEVMEDDNTKAKGTISVQNSSDRVTTIYRSISSVLTAWENGQEVKGKGYLIEDGNKLKLTFSNFDNNNYISVGNNQYNKFYVTYGLTNDDNHAVANTWTMYEEAKGYAINNKIIVGNVYYNSAKVYSNSAEGNTEIGINTPVVVTDWTEDDTCTIKFKNETDYIEVTGVPKGKLQNQYENSYSLSKDLYYITGSSSNQFSTIGDTPIVKGSSVTIEEYDIKNKTYKIKYNNSTTITGVPESYLSCSVQVETTVATQTHDKINIPTSDQFSQTKMPEVEKSYIITVNMEGSTCSSCSYRVVKNWIITPYYYRATDGLSDGDDISESINVSGNKSITAEAITDGTNTILAGTEVTISAGTEGRYNVTSEAITINDVTADKLKYVIVFNDNSATVPLAGWAQNIEVVEGKGSTNAPEKGNNIPNIDSNYLNIMIGNVSEAGTATINSDGSVTTRAGYPLGGNEYILLIVKVKASGVDGSFNTKNDNTDYKLGNLRLFVSEAS